MARKRKRRPWGGGTLYQRKSDGRWIGRVVVGKKPDGSPLYERVSDKDETKARAKFDELLERRAQVDLSTKQLVD